MFKKADPEHLKAMQVMQELIKSPEGMAAWFARKKKEFEALPEILDLKVISSSLSLGETQ